MPFLGSVLLFLLLSFFVEFRLGAGARNHSETHFVGGWLGTLFSSSSNQKSTKGEIVMETCFGIVASGEFAMEECAASLAQ